MELHSKSNDKHIYVSTTIALFMAIIFWLVSTRIPIVLIFIPGVVISLLFQYRTTAKQLGRFEQNLAFYLLFLAIQLIHFTEEYLSDFIIRMPQLFGQPSYPLSDWIVFNMAAYSFFIIGAIFMIKRWRFLYIIPLFFIVVGVFLNSLAHVALTIYSGGYFPGLYTAILYLILSPVLLSRIFR